MLVKQASAAERDAHGLEVSRGHHVTKCVVTSAVFELGTIHAISFATQRQQAGERRHRDAGNVARRFQGLRVKPAPGVVVVKLMTGRLHLHGEHARSLEPGSNREEAH